LPFPPRRARTTQLAGENSEREPQWPDMKTYLAIFLSITLQAARAAAEDTSPPLPVPDDSAIELLRISGVPEEIGLPGDLRAEAASVVKQAGSMDSTLMLILLNPDSEKEAAPQGKEQLRAQRSALARDFLARLSPAQQRRLSELYLQREGNRSLLDPGVQSALGLTGQQIAEIGEVRRKSEQAVSEINQGMMMNLVNVATGRMSQSDAKRDNDARTAQTRRREAEFTAALGNELSSDQQARLDTLKGAPFSFPPGKT